MQTLVIVNPASHAGATGRDFARTEARLRERLGELEVVWTEAPRHAAELAHKAVGSGVERLLVAGGDGTASEVADGMLASGHADRTVLGLLPLGTGGDWMRSLGQPRRFEAALDGIVRGGERRVDAARVTYCDAEGKSRTIHAVNSWSAGVSGLVTQLVTRVAKRLGPTLSFLVGTVDAIRRIEAQPVRVVVDGMEVHSELAIEVAGMLGSHYGGGMQIAPKASLDDGLLDVSVIPGLPKWELIARLPQLYLGTYVRLPIVKTLRGRVLEAEPLGEDVWIEVDGEPVGRLPARVELIPRALRVLGSQA